MFIPTTPEELKTLNWTELDVILVSGDTYIDSPFSGTALIGQQLIRSGYRVGIIAQPDVKSAADITRLGEPRLFWGVSAGAVDSLVANTTALGKPRRTDDHTPGGLNNRRPDRATIVYANLIRQHFKNTVPIVLGGVEASLRRVAHYDFWSDALRRSVLLDAKADYLLYGMADLSVLALAEALRDGLDPRGLRGLVYASAEMPADYLELPSFEEVCADKDRFIEMFHAFYVNNDPISARGLAQRYGDRYVVQNPPAPTLTTEEMDAVYALPFEHAVHPYYAAQGEVRALETIRFSIPTHRGCYGECNFCAIAVHEGRRVAWRSKASILAEARAMKDRPGFHGIIHDLSGPTANMYGFECRVKARRGACPDKSCIYPEVCPLLGLTHAPHTGLLKAVRQVEGIHKVFVGSGIRHDLVMADEEHGASYMEELVGHHVSGQLKLAPEHSQPSVLKYMRKPGTDSLLTFKQRFDAISERVGKEQYLTYYIIAAHPGCTDSDMVALRKFASEKLGVLPEQVQIFTPTPSTYSSVMYYTEKDPFTGAPLFVEKSQTGKMRQKAAITGWGKKGRAAEETEKPAPRTNARPESGQVEKPSPVRPGPDTQRVPFVREEPSNSSREDAPVVRVVRDDFGSFLHNQAPEGWVDRRAERAEPERSEWKPRHSDSGRPAREGGERPYRERKDWKPREGSADTRTPREGGERPYRERKDWKPREGSADTRTPREGGEKPYRERKDWKSRESSSATSKPREGGERPYRERKDWKSREGSADTRTQREGGEKPYRERKDWKPREGSADTRTPREGGEKPYRERKDWKSRESSSATSKPREGGEKPYRERKDWKPREGSADTRTQREGGERPYRERKDWKPRESSSATSKPREGGYKRGGKTGSSKTGNRNQSGRDYRVRDQRKDQRNPKKDKPAGEQGNSSSGEHG
ncbi:MAG TPA: YgiQ family radical SAM protein [Anaerolineaceae bacterium]|nr:YgiQ family radical SAM protein [Anaerolineaceae bacterium]